MHIEKFIKFLMCKPYHFSPNLCICNSND